MTKLSLHCVMVVLFTLATCLPVEAEHYTEATIATSQSGYGSHTRVKSKHRANGGSAGNVARRTKSKSSGSDGASSVSRMRAKHH